MISELFDKVPRAFLNRYPHELSVVKGKESQ